MLLVRLKAVVVRSGQIACRSASLLNYAPVFIDDATYKRTNQGEGGDEWSDFLGLFIWAE